MSRDDLRALADLRILEAQRLMQAPILPDGAYYLAGYAIECALKACIAGRIPAHQFPDKDFAQECFTHSIEKLVKAAGLKEARDAATTANDDLAIHWMIVKDWTEVRRYRRTDEADALALIQAITDANHGVLQWIKAHW